MHSLEFSESTTTIDEWYKLDNGVEYDKSASEILVIAFDSPIDLLTGPLDQFERIVVTSVDFNDGRIFSIGRQIRLLGYHGRLTVVGDVLQDQYLALQSCGFDEVLVLDKTASTQVVELDQAFPLARNESSASRNQKENYLTGSNQ